MNVFDALDVLEAVELLQYWRFLLCLALAGGIAFLLWREAPDQFGWGTTLLVFGPALVAGVIWERAAGERPRRRR
jgi:hypothetical protein